MSRVLSHFDPLKQPLTDPAEVEFHKLYDAEVKNLQGRWMRSKKDGRLAFAYPDGDDIRVSFSDGKSAPYL